VSVTADFLYGQGELTLPFGFALAESGASSSPPYVGQPERESIYYGASASYSPDQIWYIDFSFREGHSSGGFNLGEGGDSTFTVDDRFYQLNVRYALRDVFPRLKTSRFAVYLRLGVSYGPADLLDVSTIPGVYRQENEIQDVVGDLGLGLVCEVFSVGKLRVGLQLEAEGFYGHRWQSIQEESELQGIIPAVSSSLENDLYGAIGRLTGRFQYRFGDTGSVRLFADVGVEAKHTVIGYSGLGSYTELLWGPYVKVGLRYSF
jgi:hypothetical protein